MSRATFALCECWTIIVLQDEQAGTGVKHVWGTAKLFTNPRYMYGAATSRKLDAFAFAGAQIKKALEGAYELGGSRPRYGLRGASVG